jgi:hypothetical protein
MKTRRDAVVGIRWGWIVLAVLGGVLGYLLTAEGLR